MILKQKLEKAGTANEMFQVFAVYNQLFMRPKIRGAITQYQSQLITQVSKDIEKLKTKLLNEEKMDLTLSNLRDFPEVVTKMVWTYQL
jgi:dynein heavy chain 1